MIRKKKFDSWEKRRFPSKDDSEVVSNHRNKKSSTPKKKRRTIASDGTSPTRTGRGQTIRRLSLSLSLSLSFSVVHSRFIFLFQRVSVCGASRAMRCDAANDPRPGVPFPATNGRHRPMPHRKKAKKKPVQLGKRRRQTRNSVKTQQTYGQLYFTGTINPVKSGNRIRSSNKFEIEKTRS